MSAISSQPSETIAIINTVFEGFTTILVLIIQFATLFATLYLNKRMNTVAKKSKIYRKERLSRKLEKIRVLKSIQELSKEDLQKLAIKDLVNSPSSQTGSE